MERNRCFKRQRSSKVPSLPCMDFQQASTRNPMASCFADFQKFLDKWEGTMTPEDRAVARELNTRLSKADKRKREEVCAPIGINMPTISDSHVWTSLHITRAATCCVSVQAQLPSELLEDIERIEERSRSLKSTSMTTNAAIYRIRHGRLATRRQSGRGM